MSTINYAIFQLVRYELHLQHEAAMTKSLEFAKRQRVRDLQLKAYLNAISETVVSLKENRTFYY
jgi:hypothetical protein